MSTKSLVDLRNLEDLFDLKPLFSLNTMPHSFLPNKGNFRDLIAFQKSECIYDITFYFTKKYLSKGDRTIDQMIQAARSCKQNIAEGNGAGVTSAETEIKLINVAKASLQELLLDYEDYLRVRGLQQWDLDSEKAQQTRRVCAKHNDSAFYREAIKKRNDETIANIAITLIHQTDLLLRKIIDRLQEDFVKNGGIRESMHKARTFYRNSQYKK